MFCPLLKIIDRQRFIGKCDFYQFCGCTWNKKGRRSNCSGPYSSAATISWSRVGLPPSGIRSSLASALFPHVVFVAPVGLWIWLGFERSFVDEWLWTLFHSPSPHPASYSIRILHLCVFLPRSPTDFFLFFLFFCFFIISFIAFSSQSHCYPLCPLGGELLLTLSLQLPHWTATKSYFSLVGRALSSPHALPSGCTFTSQCRRSLPREMLAPASQRLAWFLASAVIYL